MTPEERFEKLGHTLPPSPDPLGVYKLLLVDGNYAYVSGHGTLKNDGTWIVGKVGDDIPLFIDPRDFGPPMIGAPEKLDPFNGALNGGGTIGLGWSRASLLDASLLSDCGCVSSSTVLLSTSVLSSSSSAVSA